MILDRTRRLMIGVTCVIAACGCLLGADTPDPKRHAPDAVVGANDSLSILALNCEEISKTWRVGSSGDLNLPMIGTIRAAGLTVQQLEDSLVTHLKKFLIDPQVTVYVSEFRSQPVTVTGAVDKPGVFQLEGGKTLFEVLVMAGGPKNAGLTVNLKRATERGQLQLPAVILDKDGTYSMVDLPIAEVMEGRGAKAAIPILPDDLITVSVARAQRFVHISGEVNHPGSVELVTQEAVSMTKLLAVAGGFTHDAKPGRTMILHVNSSGVQTSSTFVDLSKIQNGKARDLELTDGDVVVVPTSGAKTFMHMASGAVLSSGVYTAFNVLARY